MTILLLIADSVRDDAVGPQTAPTLDLLGQEGCRFTRSYCSGSWTVPSLAAIESGLHPHRIGVAHWGQAPQPAAPAGGILAAAGAAGLDVQVYTPAPQWSWLGWPARGQVGDSQDLAAVCAALRGRDRLVVVHHLWTHVPYVCKPLALSGHRRAADAAVDALARIPGADARLARLYAAAVRHLSEEVLPRYLDALLAGGDEVLALVTADHGETWGASLPPGRRVEHVYDLHGRWMTDETTRVPLIAWGRTPQGPVQASAPGGFARGVDLCPTLREILGQPVPADREGRSLLPSLLVGADAPATEALTVASFNVVHPETYPTDGRVQWRRYARVSASGRQTWDALDDGPGPPELAAEHARALGPAAILAAPRPTLAHALRTLGYADAS